MQTIFKGALTGAFQASAPFMIVNGLAVVDFALTVSSGPARVEWHFELTSDLAMPLWFREVTEQDLGAGQVELFPAVRSFSSLAVGVDNRDVQAAKAHDFCRIRIRVSAGAVTALVQTPFGLSVS